MKKILISLLVFSCTVVSAYGANIAVVDPGTQMAYIYDDDKNLITTTDFSSKGRPYFIRDTDGNGWLVKLMPEGRPDIDLFEIYHLAVDGTIGSRYRHASIYNSPGLHFSGLKGGNFVTAEIYQGNLYLFDIQGMVLASTDVWNDPDGWPYAYGMVGDVAGLTGGGFVVLPERGTRSQHMTGINPYIYFYDNNLNLVGKVDITSLGIFMYTITGLPGNEFVGLGNYGGGKHITHLFYFDAGGNMINAVDITGDIATLTNDFYLSYTISSLEDGGVIVSHLSDDRYLEYHSPPVEVDLSGDGVTGIAGVGGNYLLAGSQSLIELSALEAVAGSREVAITWTTASETDNAGFNIYRAASVDGAYVQINTDLILAEGSPTGGSAYRFVDKGLQNRTNYYYKLEDIDTSGTPTMHGPVSAMPLLMYGLFN